MASAGVEVEFVDAVSGRTIVRTTEKATALPPFEKGGRVTLGPAIREILDVTPPDPATWAATGRVVIRTKKVGDAPHVDTGRRFTVPTLAEELPELAVVEGLDPDRLLDLHEDDWRQIELFGAAAKSKVKQQLRAIDEVRHRNKTPDGYSRLHIRDLDRPLEHVRLALADLEQVLPASAEKLAGIALRGQIGVVTDGYAWALPTGGVLYVVAPGGQVEIAGYRRALLAGGESDDAMILGALLTRFGVWLVDWCGPWVVKGDRDELEKWLTVTRPPAEGTRS